MAFGNVTIYEVLKTKLGREPTHQELKDEVKRILKDAYDDRATKGMLPYQRGK